MARVGRSKTRTEKIEDNKTLMSTFGKRLPSFVKKAYEMGTLTGVDVALLVVSPSGKLTPFSINSRIEDIIAKFVNLPDDKRGIRIGNQGHLLETLERKHDDNDALVRQQMASSSGSSSDIQAAITELENKRDVLRQHLRNFSCDNDVPMTAESFELRQERILAALAQVRERKLQLHLQQQQQFNVPMQQELPFDFHQNNKNMPMLQAPFQTTPRTLQAVFDVPVKQELPFNFNQNDFGNMPMPQAPFQTTPRTQQPLFNVPMQEELPFDFYQNNYGNMPMLQAQFQTTLGTQQDCSKNDNELFAVVKKFCSGRSFSSQVAERQNPDAAFQQIGFAGSSGQSFSGQVAEQQNPDAVFRQIGFAGSSGGSFRNQVAEQQNRDAAFQQIGCAGQVAEQQNLETLDYQICLPTNGWSNPPHKFDQSDHTHQSNLIQECTPAPPQQECTTSPIANDLIPSRQPDYKEWDADLDQQDPCALYLMFPEDGDIGIFGSNTAPDPAEPLPHRL